MKIKFESDDDAEFIKIVDNVVLHITEIFEPTEIVIVKVDNWFDHKWLRFSGKILGSLGVWKDKLTLPPINPGRIVWERAYAAPLYDKTKRKQPLHINISSSQATQRKMSDIEADTAIIWFSGKTNSNGRGAVMVYHPMVADHLAWYSGWVKQKNWEVVRLKGISQTELLTYTASKNLPENYVEMTLAEVHDEETFLAFLLALSLDRKDEVRKGKNKLSCPYGPGANGWENGTIEDFLEAAHAGGTATLGSMDTADHEYNIWRHAASILYSGKYYE